MLTHLGSGLKLQKDGRNCISQVGEERKVVVKILQGGGGGGGSAGRLLTWHQLKEQTNRQH